MDGLLDTLELIRDRMITGKPETIHRHELDLEYLFHLSKIIKTCRTMMETYPFIQDLKTLKKILFQVLDTSRLPFSGEPLQGLQVMGVLETRAIDFENLVVLSVNEGILPSGRLPNSFIPFDIKSNSAFRLSGIKMLFLPTTFTACSSVHRIFSCFTIPKATR